MILFPEVQEKAQAEIDKVVGNDRLPAVADRNSLPYVGSVLKEVLRWRPVVPMGGLLFMTPPFIEVYRLIRFSLPFRHGGRRLPRLSYPVRHGSGGQYLVRFVCCTR